MIKAYFSYYIYHQKENENKTPFLPGGLSWNKNRLWDISWGWSSLGRFFRDLEVSLQHTLQWLRSPSRCAQFL